MDKHINEILEKDFALGIADLIQLFCNSCSERIYRYYISDDYDPEVSSYPVCCKSCGNVVNKVYIPDEVPRKLATFIHHLLPKPAKIK
tara:strand:- start:1461 stop:1724 length:264 start_codon:yes stop_codon:yes gene_type:complete